MERSEAIKILKAAETDKFPYDSGLLVEAMDMAISSLETDEAYQLEYERTTKNDLGVEYISRQAVIDLMMQKWGENFSGDDAMQESIDAIRELPSVTPQEPQTFKWCTDCKEYDQEKHCCHRWSKVIRNAVDELKQEPKTGHWIKGYTFPDGAYWKCDKCNELIKVKIPMRYCNNCGAKMVEPQESEDNKYTKEHNNE